MCWSQGGWLQWHSVEILHFKKIKGEKKRGEWILGSRAILVQRIKEGVPANPPLTWPCFPEAATTTSTTRDRVTKRRLIVESSWEKHCVHVEVGVHLANVLEYSATPDLGIHLKPLFHTVPFLLWFARTWCSLQLDNVGGWPMSCGNKGTT